CRSSYYYQCCPETEENLALMRRLDELHLEHPVYGSRKLAVSLRREGLVINRKRVVRLLRLMGIEAIYAKPRKSLPAPGRQIYPYLLRGLEVTGPDQVWCADITYVPMARGFMYLVAVMDGWSRYVAGLTAIARSVRTTRWVMRRRQKCTLIPAPTAPSQPTGKRCSPKAQGRTERLEVRPPAAVSIGTRRKRRGRTGGARHGSFSLLQMVLERRVNDRQTKATMTADRENPSYFLRSVV